MDKVPETRNTETLALKAEGKDYFKDQWFDAFYKGISLIPQNGDGIRLCLAIGTVLEDADMDWPRFESSKISSEQINFLGRAMNAQHAQKGIGVRVTDIRENRIESLWELYRATTVRMLINYIDSIPDLPVSNWESALENFFLNPQNKMHIDELKRILGVIRATLDKAETMKLLAEYRGKLNQAEPGEDIWAHTYRSQFIKIIKENFNNETPALLDALFIINE